MTTWLRSLPAERLAAVLEARPDTRLPPVPRSITELAARLRSPLGITAALQRLPLPALEVMHAVEAGATGPAAIADRLGVEEHDEDLIGSMVLLAEHALLWGDRDTVAPTGGPARVVPPAPADGTTGGTARRDGRAGDVPPPLPWHPRPPRPATMPLDPRTVAREAAAAATATVGGAGAVLGAAPLTMLKAGGVGVRELRRVSRQVGAEVPAVRLWLELGYEAGLLDTADGDTLLATGAYDEWAAAEPAHRLVELIDAWDGLPGSPGCVTGPALIDDPWGALIAELRGGLLDVLADVPDGTGLADPVGYLTEALIWLRPLLCRVVPEVGGDGHAAVVSAGGIEILAPGVPVPGWPQRAGAGAAVSGGSDAVRHLVAAMLAEARLLGLVALGALTPLGRALRDPDPDELTRVAATVVAPATRTAIFQADLTAVVPGTPGAGLAGLLDAAADREARGTASTWRFSPVSVRRALDSGHDPDELAARLRAVATGGELPQPLTYLIKDVGRRHGEVRVHQVASVLHTDDEALLAELLAAKALSRLALRRLAPTVLASACPAPETLEVLRAAGYAPVGLAVDGQPLVTAAGPRRLPAPDEFGSPPPARRPAAGGPDEPADDPLALATALLAAPDTQPPDAGTRRTLGSWAGQLTSGDRDLLAYAIETGSPVLIHYVDADGRRTERVIEPLVLSGGMLVAWCRLRDDERMFLLDRIAAVAPA